MVAMRKTEDVVYGFVVDPASLKAGTMPVRESRRMIDMTSEIVRSYVKAAMLCSFNEPPQACLLGRSTDRRYLV